MPKPPGRPSKSSTPEAQRVAELERLLAEKDLELQQVLVREEVALIPLSFSGDEHGSKYPSRVHRNRR